MKRWICLLLPILLLSVYARAAFQDSAILPASERYRTSFALRKLFAGNNYRETWSLPVKMKLFDIGREKGGFRIIKLGGGAETKSLRLIDSDRVEWVLRTVDKDVRGVMPRKLRNTFIRPIIQDLISTAYPYAPLVVAPLGKQLGLDVPEPELFYVPDDTAFGKYQPLFAHKVCMLERYSPTRDNTKSISTDSLYKLIDEPGYRVDDTSLLKGRLLDMLIVDWDRHDEQYKWGMVQQGEEKIFYPILRDRDQAFFYSDGLILLKTRIFALKYMTNFNNKVRNLRQLNKRSGHIDRAFLNKLDENDWRRIIQQFQQALSDSVLEAAIKKIPQEAYNKDAEQFFTILRTRRNGLMKPAIAYYHLLSEKVMITGSNGNEQVQISNDGSSLSVTVLNRQSQKIVYQRQFDPAYTREIRLSLLAGDDELIVDKSVSSQIKIFVDGGEGKDHFSLAGNLHVTLDKESENEIISR